MMTGETLQTENPPLGGVALSGLLAASSLDLPLVFEVLKNNVDVKRDVSDDVLLRWSDPKHLSGGLISLDWHRGYNRALVELQEELISALKGEAIPSLVRPRNLRSQSTPGLAGSLSDLSLSGRLPK